jgi:hypothetical protein
MSMNIWIIIVALFFGLLILCMIVNWLIERKRSKQERKKRQDKKWLQQHGKHIVAYVTDVKARQDWRYEDGSQWNEWEGQYEQARTWQTFYSITAEWKEPQTQQNYSFSFNIWADELTSKPMVTSPVPVVCNPKKPEHYYADLKVS